MKAAEQMLIAGLSWWFVEKTTLQLREYLPVIEQRLLRRLGGIGSIKRGRKVSA